MRRRRHPNRSLAPRSRNMCPPIGGGVPCHRSARRLFGVAGRIRGVGAEVAGLAVGAPDTLGSAVAQAARHLGAPLIAVVGSAPDTRRGDRLGAQLAVTLHAGPGRSIGWPAAILGRGSAAGDRRVTGKRRGVRREPRPPSARGGVAALPCVRTARLTHGAHPSGAGTTDRSTNGTIQCPPGHHSVRALDGRQERSIRDARSADVR